MKLFIVVLVILAVLFGLSLALGAGRDKDSKPGESGFEQALGRLSKPFRPKVDLPKKTFAYGADHSIPGSDTPFRAVTLGVTPGCTVKLTYESDSPKKKNLNPQEVTLPQGDGSKRHQTVLTFLKGKGVLKVGACTSTHKPCPGKLSVIEE